jgi:hypothetical protein
MRPPSFSNELIEEGAKLIPDQCGRLQGRPGVGGGCPGLARSAAALEELDGPFVLLGGAARSERAEILTTLGARIDLAGIEPVFAAWKLSDHGRSKAKSASWE